jgi:hypothetical protein
MRTTLAVTAFVFAAALTLLGASLAGVNFDDSITVDGKKLVLNGMGIRSRFMVKVYVGALYLEQKSTDANAIMQADAPKQMVMHFLRGVDGDTMVEAYREAFANNAPDAQKTLKAEIDRLLSAFEPLKEGDRMSFTYVPGKGTTMAISGKEKVTIQGMPFAKAMFSAWLGPKPPSNDLKKGLLGP